MNTILSYLSLLQKNNDRTWFNEHKEAFLLAQQRYEKLCQQFMLSVSQFDSDMQHVQFKECNFRIYRDIRFSKDKKPYKTHFGAFFAYPNGRKSHRGGYYLHIEPQHTFIGIGVWKPEKNHLQAIRQHIYDHYEEFRNMSTSSEFVQNFGTTLSHSDKLKRVPAGFPKDFQDPEILKHKNYIVSHPFDDEMVSSEKFVHYLAQKAESGYPFLAFLNEAIDEK